jgi:hypothetical protein
LTRTDSRGRRSTPRSPNSTRAGGESAHLRAATYALQGLKRFEITVITDEDRTHIPEELVRAARADIACRLWVTVWKDGAMVFNWPAEQLQKSAMSTGDRNYKWPPQKYGTRDPFRENAQYA